LAGSFRRSGPFYLGHGRTVTAARLCTGGGRDAALSAANCAAAAVCPGDRELIDIDDRGWRLFDLAADPGEIRDLAAEHPQRLAELSKAWNACAKDVGVCCDGTVQRSPLGCCLFRLEQSGLGGGKANLALT
jgi:hypothetical protein